MSRPRTDLVLLHGWGMNSAVWSGFTRRLAERWRLTLIDLPGHGASPYRGETVLQQWADACLESAPQRAVWLGWSLGGLVALEAALRATGAFPAVVSYMVSVGEQSGELLGGRDVVDRHHFHVVSLARDPQRGAAHAAEGPGDRDGHRHGVTSRAARIRARAGPSTVPLPT